MTTFSIFLQFSGEGVKKFKQSLLYDLTVHWQPCCFDLHDCGSRGKQHYLSVSSMKWDMELLHLGKNNSKPHKRLWENSGMWHWYLETIYITVSFFILHFNIVIHTSTKSHAQKNWLQVVQNTYCTIKG